MKKITNTTNDIQDEWLENYPYDEIDVGDSAYIQRTLTMADIQAFAAVSGDTNPAHLDPEYANDTLFHGVIGHGMWGGSLISTVLGTVFPGPGLGCKKQKSIDLDQQKGSSYPIQHQY